MNRLEFKILIIIYITFTAERLNNAFIGVSNTQPVPGQPIDLNSYSLCAQCPNSLTANIFSVFCAKYTLPGRYVILQSSLENNYMNVAEVEVYAVQ